ncbi:amidohydrolase [Paenibacillus allorhizosphaerae]|uniref:N-acyl-L-amino acid amidohydrolase n=1 Tax=Paenibacillus allorhizosphaerae TaxID=2849866 RepID=A0ABM8VC20_9BACL|nr:amidohydrolase [Paenibacillus allorhizosphaerae]CAG7622678.1 N-acyl-L-amino acid amidohydrolase [Paenibacillus allorhizosphaerae]
MSRWSEAVEAVYPDMVKWRRYLHMNPELSFQESQTAAFVASLLQEWGIEARTGVGGHGIVARIEGAAKGPTVALRADMDALPIQDEKSCEYASKVPGVMHACGHDAHTATLLGVAKLMNEHRDQLAGNVVFLFQPAEETTPGGAIEMIRDGALEGVDVIYGIHLWTPFETGAAYCKPGAIMAAADEFIIEIKGKGGHGGLPHQTVDSIYVASQLVVNFQGIVSRFSDPTQPCVVTVGSFHSGTSFNVIAETATLKGTVRTFDPELRLQVKRRLEDIAEYTCRMNGAECAIKYNLGYPPVINHAAEEERFRRAAAAALGEQGARTSPLIMAGEDYAYYLERIPGCFMFVGAGHKERGIVHPHHHPRFDIDEIAMHHAAKLFIRMTEDYLAEHAYSR